MCACSGEEFHHINRLWRADRFLPGATKVVTTTDDDNDERAFVSGELSGVVFAPCTAAVTVAAGVLAIYLLAPVIECAMIVAVVVAFIVAGLSQRTMTAGTDSSISSSSAALAPIAAIVASSSATRNSSCPPKGAAGNTVTGVAQCSILKACGSSR